MTGNGWNPTNKNRDDWGMVFGYVMMVMFFFYSWWLMVMIVIDTTWVNGGELWLMITNG